MQSSPNGGGNAAAAGGALAADGSPCCCDPCGIDLAATADTYLVTITLTTDASTTPPNATCSHQVVITRVAPGRGEWQGSYSSGDGENVGASLIVGGSVGNLPAGQTACWSIGASYQCKTARRSSGLLVVGHGNADVSRRIPIGTYVDEDHAELVYPPAEDSTTTYMMHVTVTVS